MYLSKIESIEQLSENELINPVVSKDITPLLSRCIVPGLQVNIGFTVSRTVRVDTQLDWFPEPSSTNMVAEYVPRLAHPRFTSVVFTHTESIVQLSPTELINPVVSTTKFPAASKYKVAALQEIVGLIVSKMV